MGYKEADRIKKLGLQEQQHQGKVSTVIVRGSANRDNKSKNKTSTTAGAAPKAAAPVKKSTVKNTTTTGSKTTEKKIQTKATDAESYAKALEELDRLAGRAVSGLSDLVNDIFQGGGNLAAAQADANRTTADTAAKQIRRTADSMGKSGGNLAAAQANANRTTADTVVRKGKAIWDTHAEAESGYGKAVQKQAEQNEKTVKKAGKAIWEQAGKTGGVTSGVTGSDQTGASFYGYQNDTRMKEPNKNWDIQTLKEYQRLKHTNKKDAEQFAISVNTDYLNKQNEALRRKQAEKLREQINDDYYAILHSIGARGGALFKGLDAYNSLLEYAATGRMDVKPSLTLGEYSQIADDAIAGRLKQKYGKGASGAYRLGTEAFDGITTYAVGGPTTDIVRSAGESAFSSLEKARRGGATDKQAAEYAFLNGVGSAVIDVGVGEIADKVEGIYSKKHNLRNDRRADINNAAVIAIASGIKSKTESSLANQIFGQNEYDSIVKMYKEKGYTDKQAKHIASYEVLKKKGMGALDDVMLDAAQRKFAETLKRAMKQN